MNLNVKFLHRMGWFCQKAGYKLSSYKNTKKIWIDVGSHLGRKTFRFAQANPLLTVYAFEPNLKVAAKCMGLLPNFVLIPMAVSEYDGCADFYINTFDAASSLYPFNPKGLQNWISHRELKVESKLTVPTIRLDTFMDLMDISHCVDYLKIDAQGADFAVIKSAGDRLVDIQKITLEVAVTPKPLYKGSFNSKDEIVDYLEKRGFTLMDIKEQSYGQEENLTFVRNPLTKGEKK